MKEKENIDPSMDQEKVWNKIAQPWETFRRKPLEEVIEFLKKQKKGSKVLDLGCGSGRNFTKIEGTIYAVDFSTRMLRYASEHAKEKKLKVIIKQAQAYKLPFRDNYFDAAIFIAVLHCIDSTKKREKSLRELYRVMKPGAEAMLSVWSKNHERIKNKPKEAMIPWTIEGKKYMRYNYTYDKEELEQLLKRTGFKIKKSIEDDNITIIIQK